MRKRTSPDAGMLILTELGQWTGEERLQYVAALRELSVRAAVPVSLVPPGDPLHDPLGDALHDPLGDAVPPRAPRTAYAAAFGEAERAVRALWRPELDGDQALRAAVGHAIAEISRMRELLFTGAGA
jgi:hypothetical protein